MLGFPLSGMLFFPDIYVASLSSLSSHWLKSYLFNDIYPEHSILNYKFFFTLTLPISSCCAFSITGIKIYHLHILSLFYCLSYFPLLEYSFSRKGIFVCFVHLNQKSSHFNIQQNTWKFH